MSTINNTMSFHVSSSQAVRINALMTTRRDKTPVEMVAQIIEMGIYQLEYRSKMNKRNAELKKVGRATLNAINDGSNVKVARDLAIALGLAVPSDDIVEVE